MSAVGKLVAARQAELAKEYGGPNRVPTNIGNPSYVHKWLRSNRYGDYRAAEREDEEAFRASQREVAKRIREAV